MSFSYALWDYQDGEFSDLTSDQAKACRNDRSTLEGALDHAREEIARGIADAALQPTDVLRFPVNADSDVDMDEADVSIAPALAPRPLAVMTAEGLGIDCTDKSPAFHLAPIVVFPACIEPGCSTAGNLALVSCVICEGDLHRQCGTIIDDNEKECQERRCTNCPSGRKGNRKAR